MNEAQNGRDEHALKHFTARAKNPSLHKNISPSYQDGEQFLNDTSATHSSRFMHVGTSAKPSTGNSSGARRLQIDSMRGGN